MGRATTTRSPSAAERSPHFDVHVLAGFSVCWGGVALEVGTWPRRGRSLLRLLAATPQHRRLREEVVDILWPEATLEAGSSNVRCLLYRVRRAMDSAVPAPVVPASGWIMLNPDCRWEIDLERFEELVHGAGEDLQLLREAAELAGGESLEEDRYEDWAVPVREHVWRHWRQTCLHLARLHRVWGSREEAVGWFERVLERDPLDEEALQGVLGVLGEAGRESEALRRYQQFAQRLQRELDVPPGAETLALAASLRAGPKHGGEQQAGVSLAGHLSLVVPSYPLPTPATLVGQDSALERLLTALSAAGSGEATMPRLVLLGGEAGMGKTRLLGETARKAQEAEMLVLAGGCYEQEGRLPYGPIHDALLDYVRAQPDQVLRSPLDDLPDLFRILPEARARLPMISEVSSGDAESQRLRLFAAVAQLLERMTVERPLVLLLDDLQWADEATLQLLHYLLRQTRLQRLLVVGSYREEEVARGTPIEQLLRSVDGTDAVQRIQVRALSHSDLAHLLADRLAGPGDETLIRTLHERSAGNPFFALQMLGLLQAEGGIVRHEDVWRMEPGMSFRLPIAVREAIARRLRQVGPDEREALTLGAVLGREFGYPALAALWEGTERSLFAALDAALEVHLVGETEDGYVFQHPLLWEVVYQGAPASRRTLFHERAGLALERLYGSRAEEHAAELAYHFAAVGHKYRDRAVRYLTLAGDQAEAAFAHVEAERQYRTAVQLAQESRDEPTRVAIYEKLAVPLCASGRYDEALEILGRAAAAYERSGDLEGLFRVTTEIGVAHAGRGTLEEGLRCLQGVLDRVPAISPSPDLVRLHGALGGLLFRLGRHGEQLEAAERAVAVAETLGDTRTLGVAKAQHGLALLTMWHRDEGRHVLEEAIALADEAGDLETLVHALNNAAWVYEIKGEFPKSITLFERALQVARRMGDVAQIAFKINALGRNAFLSGNWQEARAYLEEAQEISHDMGPSFVSPYAVLELGRLSLARGDLEAAGRYLEQGLDLATADADLQALRTAERLLAELDLARGDPELARSRLRAAGVTEEWAPQEFDAILAMPLLLARALCELGQTIQARAIVLKVVDQAQRSGELLAAVEALAVRGLVATGDGEWQEADGAFEAAVTLARNANYPYGEARALFDWGRMHAMRGDEERAREWLEAALTIFRRLGALLYAERSQQALAELSAGPHPLSSQRSAP